MPNTAVFLLAMIFSPLNVVYNCRSCNASLLASARPQFLRGTKPIFIRRSFRTSSRSPELVSQRRDVIMSERGDAMSVFRRVTMLMGVLRVLKSLPRMLVSRLVILFSLLLRNPMAMRSGVVQFGGALMVLVVRSIVISSGHDQILTIWPDLVWTSLASL